MLIFTKRTKMYKITVTFGVALLVLGCASQKSMSPKGGGGSSGHTRTKPVVLLDNTAYLITDATTDKTYGFAPANPVKVGSSGAGGPVNERRYLNSLLGPNGEPVTYFRAGSCCPFKTPNGLINDMGMLDNYRVTWQDAKDTVSIYINMYDDGDLFIPVGFTSRKKE